VLETEKTKKYGRKTGKTGEFDF